jgi:hypothetical protein
MSESRPHPPIGSQRVHAASTSSTAAVTKLGRLMPTSVTDKLAQSSSPSRFTAASVPRPTPTNSAIVSANSPSATETGRLVNRMSFTDHSRYCIDQPKSPRVSTLSG